MDNYKLSHQLLTFENLSPILTALKGYNTSLEDSSLDSSIEKLKNLIPEDKAETLSQLMQQIIITKQPWTKSTKHKEWMVLLRQGIESRRVLTISYQNYANQVSLRQVEPISLVFRGYTWYLFAYCHMKGDFRLFRLSRIQEASIDKMGFEGRGVSYEAIYGQDDKTRQLIEVILRFDPDFKTRVEDIFVQDQIEVLDTGALLVRTDFSESEWYYSFILSFDRG